MRINYSQPVLPQLAEILNDEDLISEFIQATNADERIYSLTQAFLETPTDDLSSHILTQKITLLVEENPFLLDLKKECVRAISQIEQISPVHLWTHSPKAKRRLNFDNFS